MSGLEGHAAARAATGEVEEGGVPPPRRRARDLGWTLFGKLVMTGANSALVLSLAWFGLFDRRTYGLFAAVIGAQLLLSRLVLLGVDQGAIRFYTRRDLGVRPETVLAAGLVQSLLLSSPVAVLGVTLALLGVTPWSASVVLSVALGAVGLALFDYGIAERLAKLRYRRAGLAQAAMPVLRLAATLGAVHAFPQRPGAAFLAYAASPVLCAWILTHRTIRSTEDWPPVRLVRELFAYSRWPGVTDVLMILVMNEGLFLLGALGLEDERGVFGFAQQLMLGFFAVFLAFYQTILPRASRLAGAGETPRFLARWVRIGGLLALGCLVAAPAVAAVIHATMPNRELAAFPVPFFLLTGFACVLLLEAPLTAACHALLLPQLTALNLALRALFIGPLALLLAPRFGASGAAAAQLAGSLLSALVLLLLLLRAIAVRRAAEAG